MIVELGAVRAVSGKYKTDRHASTRKTAKLNTRSTQGTLEPLVSVAVNIVSPKPVPALW